MRIKRNTISLIPCRPLKTYSIKAGETEEFIFEIDKMNDLGFVNSKGERFFEGGKFELMAGDKSLEFDFQ